MGKRVLIVDDSTYSRTVIRDALEPAGYEIVGMADTGEKAIDMAVQLIPDIITLDNVLPDMTGIDVLRVLQEEDMRIFIVMVSAVGQQSIVDEALSVGAQAYIMKPIVPDELLRILALA
jgi:two-component system, chemotaxis family, chemotaxis protein CheY